MRLAKHSATLNRHAACSTSTATPTATSSAAWSNDAELVAEGLLQGLTQLLPGVATILGTLVRHGCAELLSSRLVVVSVTPVSICVCGLRCQAHNRLFQGASSAAQGRLSGFVNEMVAGQERGKAPLAARTACEAQFDAISGRAVRPRA